MSGDKLILNSSIVRLLITNGEKKIKMYNEWSIKKNINITLILRKPRRLIRDSKSKVQYSTMSTATCKQSVTSRQEMLLTCELNELQHMWNFEEKSRCIIYHCKSILGRKG
jgi:hypothetical protein